MTSPWGEPTYTLDQMHERLAVAPAAVLFTHVAQGRLRQGPDDRPPADDLSHWIANSLQDPEAAERLAFALEPPYEGAEQVRARLLSVLATMGARRRREHRAAEGAEFVFLQSTSVRFPCGAPPTEDLEAALADAGLATWFLYLTEEPWFAEGRSTLLDLLAEQGARRLHDRLAEVAHSSEPLGQARARWRRRLRTRGLARRVAERSLAARAHPDAGARDT
ncbi:MAG: DUF5752 family protein, partial [Candidatus Eisenbacteria bacterium]